MIDHPKGPTAGGILDMWQRPITDLGLTGPDLAEGGKYLVVPPGQKAPKDVEGDRVFESPQTTSFMRFAKQFWALTLYDTETRIFIDTKHDIARLDSRKDLIKNTDGSVDLYIGPEADGGRH